ncbi:hypothetical protein FOB83_27385 (plasmid) [Cupriavidus metallidurans]|nr:hypothetical protein FOB83_27385 [Cupriavidus metallidurans]
MTQLRAGLFVYKTSIAHAYGGPAAIEIGLVASGLFSGAIPYLHTQSQALRKEIGGS